MGHNYYSDDFQKGNESRLKYLDSWFVKLAEKKARENGLTLSQYLSKIKNFRTFKEILPDVFDADKSLKHYIDGMKEKDYRDFYNRPLIQDLIDADLEEEPENIEEIIPKVPFKIKQENKITKVYYKTKYFDKKKKETKRTIGYEDYVMVKGKKQVRFRDSKGRFTKKVL